MGSAMGKNVVRGIAKNGIMALVLGVSFSLR